MHTFILEHRYILVGTILAAILFSTPLWLPDRLFAAEKRPADNTEFAPEMLAGLKFRMIGPYRGGRVTAVDGVPGNPPTLYFGGTGGGVWRSTNNGLSYENVSDDYFEVGSIGAVAVAPSDPNVIYVGTGSACIRSNVSTGRGVYKTTDAAKTWKFAGLPEAGQIGKIRVHPRNPDIVYVAALGHAFGPNPERGVYRSQDGGKSWKLVLFLSDTVGAVDLSMNSRNPQEIYASMWRAERKPWTIISGGKQGGIYKTTDGGDTWTKLTNGLPTELIGKTAVSVSPANPQRVYALVEAPDDRGGLYRSDDAGATWHFINGQKSLMYRPFYYTHVHADPADENTVYVNCEGFFKSTNAGSSFVRIRTPHGDNHDLWINPENPDYLFQANDGGVNVSLDGGRTWSEQYNQATAEMYHVVVDNQTPYWVYGEQQDNSTIMVPSLPPIAGRLISPKQFWRAVAGCETGPIAVHPTKPHIVYGGCKGRFSRYNHLTGQEQQYWVYPHFNYGHAASEMPYRFQRTSPIEISPHNPDVIYHASQYVHKTSDEGRTWEIISPDLTAHPEGTQGYSGEPITHDITGEEIYSAIYQLRESLLEEGVLWAGSNDGLLHITRDGGKTWKNITPKNLPPGGRVQTIDPSPHHAGTAYVAIYRYMLDDWAPYIYKTSDYGETWRRLTDGRNGIPANHPTRVVREDPDRKGLLYAGTEFGLWVSFDDGGHWQSLQRNLPHTPVTDIKVHRKDLVLSTMGRSFWILDDITPLHQLDEKVAAAAAYLFQPRQAYRMRRAGARRSDNGAVPEYPPNGAMIYYYLAKKPEHDITLDILDAGGAVIRSFSSRQRRARPAGARGQRMQPGALSREAGMHRFVWDLRYPAPAMPGSGQFEGRGPLAVPGTYKIRLTVGDWQQTRDLVVRMDPRVEKDNVTLADLEAQFAFNSRLGKRINELWSAVKNIRTIREQLEKIAAGGENGRAKNLARQIRGKLGVIEEALVQTQKGKVGAQLKPKLFRQLTYLGGMTTRADQRPGQDAYKRLEDIEQILNGHTSALQTLVDTDLAQLNAVLREQGMKEIVPQK